MMVGIYATLGFFLLLASREPEAHLSLIWFTVWSSIATGPSWLCRRSAIRPSMVTSSPTYLLYSSPRLL